MSMTQKFCKSLSNAISFRIPGDSNTMTFNPCCLYDKYIPYHPTVFNKYRKVFTEAPDFLDDCSKCKLKEKTHGVSLRTTSAKQIPDDIGNDIYKLEIVLDTTCNAACIQCGDAQSSLWRKQKAEKQNIIHIIPEAQIDKRIELIKQSIDISKVKYYHFWGGEPLLTDTHIKFLNEIENPKEVSIAYTTNGSIFPDESLLQLWSQFKEVRIGVSIDGIDNRFYYIRWPLHWDKVERNLKDFRDNTPSNTFFHVNCCIIPLNAYYVDELGEWLYSNFSKTTHGSPISYNFIRGEGTMDISKTPMSLREKVWKKLGDNHDVSNVLKEVPVEDPLPMLHHLRAWDPVRKLDWKTTFPDIVLDF